MFLAAALVPVTAAGQRTSAQRVVSVVPSLTEVLLAIDAGGQLVGVSSFDTLPSEVGSLPRVGALLDPDTERILSLRPDLVIIYASQSELQAQLARAGIATFVYRHGGIQAVLDSIGALGAVTGRTSQADSLQQRIRERLDAVRRATAGRPRPRTMLVFERQPGSLREVYASGGTGFLHDMLEVAGGTNVFGAIPRESVQPSTETLITAAPEVILELRATGLIEGAGTAPARDAWSVLSSVPAVRNGRIHVLEGDYLVVPGPRLADAVEAIAGVLHPGLPGSGR